MGCSLRWPVFAGDTDLWYHLNGGRYIAAHHALPKDLSYFSFLTPSPPYYDFFWLFQLLAYEVHHAGGYLGLVLFRSVAFAAILALVWGYLLKGQVRRLSWAAVLLPALYAMFLIPRYQLVRPHTIVYLLCAASVILLDGPTRWLPLLPLVTVLWGNFHGASYPVAVLVTGAAAADYFALRWRGKLPPDAQTRLAWAGVAMATLFLTPLGADLIDLPFVPMVYAAKHIAEYLPLHAEDFAALTVTSGAPSADTVFNVILWLALLAAASSVVRRRSRPFHLALLAGGLYLLTKGNRFRYECSLLMLPVLRANPLWERKSSPGLPTAVAALALAPFLAMPFAFYRAEFWNPPKYPISSLKLPHGVASFLEREGPGGTILNFPSSGGYLQWRLSPRYKIAADMQTLFIGDQLYFALLTNFSDWRFLKRTIDRYHPDFITVPIDLPTFPPVIRRFPDYAPVFFDDVEALWVDRRRHPELARKWALPFDPALAGEPARIAQIAPPPKNGLPPYLERMLAIDPDVILLQAQAAEYCLAHEDGVAAEAHADNIRLNHPESALGYFLKGRALTAQRRFPEARSVLLAALKRSDASARGNIFKALAYAELLSKHPKEDFDLELPAETLLEEERWGRPSL